MLTDAQMIEVIALKLDDEVPWATTSKVLNHSGWLDVVTYLWTEKGLRGALIEAYKTEIEAARFNAICKDSYDDSDYDEWKADVATRGGC